MANVTIIDTGYVSVDTSVGTQLSSVANSGVALELKGVNFTYKRGSNLDNTPAPGDSQDVEVNQNSFENANLIITGVLNRGKLDGTNSDMDELQALDEMVIYQGIKCVYYNDTLTDETGYPLITKFLGDAGSDYTGHPVEKHFHVRFNKFQVAQSSDGNTYRYTLEGTTTK